MDFGLSSLLRHALDAARTSGSVLASIAFVALAIAAIQYDETVAPKFSSIADNCAALITDVGRRLTLDRA